MKRLALAVFLILSAAIPGHAISTIDTQNAQVVNDDGVDIVFAEISDNSDSVIYLKKDSLLSTNSSWTFYLHGLTKSDTRGVLKYTDADVFQGFSFGPASTVFFTKDKDSSAGGVRSIYYGNFFNGDSQILVSGASYPAYVASNKTYNFAYVKDANAIYVSGMLPDTATESVTAAKIVDLADGAGVIRYVRWSPDAQSLVFMLESTTESTASIYVVTNPQTMAVDTAATNVSDSKYFTKITADDTYYYAFPHFVGSNQFVLYNRANPHKNFKFSNFSDTGGCTSLILNNTNWDALLYDRTESKELSIETGPQASVSMAASHRGYLLTVRDDKDTKGRLYSSVLKSTKSVTASTSGTLLFPANAQIRLEAGAVPTSVFTVIPDTPTSGLRSDTLNANVTAVINPIYISSTVPKDSMDIVKITLVLSYTDLDVAQYVELATVALAHDTGATKWGGTGGGVSTSQNTVTFSPAHFSAFGVGVSKNFTPILKGESCVIRRSTKSPGILEAARRLRDWMLGRAWGRKLTDLYYAPAD